MIKRIVCIVLLCGLVTVTARAQEDDEKNDRVEAMKVAFITQRLNLSPAEAKAFWPVFNVFTDEMKKIKSKEKEKEPAKH